VRGDVSAKIRNHILGLPGEWTVEAVCDALPDMDRDAIATVINNMLVREMIIRVATGRSRIRGVIAVYETVNGYAPTTFDKPEVWGRLMKGQRYEDVRFKRPA